MGTTRVKYPAVLAAGLFVALTGAIAQQGGGSAGGNTDKSGSTDKMNSGKMSSDKAGSSAAAGTKASAADTKFVQEAAIGGMAEVEMGRVATQKAQNDKVKQFGQRMIDDHTKANDELKSIASSNNIQIPSELDAKHKAMMTKLEG